MVQDVFFRNHFDFGFDLYLYIFSFLYIRYGNDKHVSALCSRQRKKVYVYLNDSYPPG